MTRRLVRDRSDALLAWLLVANVVAHLAGITDPIVGHHAWRQADTAAIARNYFEIDGSFFRPRIDFLGNASGITGTEFPIYSYIVSLGYRLGGEHLVIARGLSVACSCVALAALYAIAATWLGRRAGLASAFLLACSPVFFHYGRNVQPDMMMIAAGLGGIAAWLHWEHTRGVGSLIAATVAFAGAAMIKPYALVFLAPVAVGWTRRSEVYGRALVFTCALGATLAWYAFARQLTHAYGDFRYFGEFLYAIAEHPVAAAAASLQSREFYTGVLLRGFRKLYVGYVGAIFLAIGLATIPALPTTARRALAIWVAASLAWIVLAGPKVAVHEYYALPLIPALAIIAGAGFDRAWGRGSRTFHAVALGLLVVAPVLPLVHSARLRGGNLNPALVNVERLLHDVVPRDARIVIGPDSSPVVALYHAHRRGWTFPTIVTAATLGNFVARGASVLVSADPSFDQDPVVVPYLERQLTSDGAVRVFALTANARAADVTR